MKSFVLYNCQNPKHHPSLKKEALKQGFQDYLIIDGKQRSLPNSTLFHPNLPAYAAWNKLRVIAVELQINLQCCLALKLSTNEVRWILDDEAGDQSTDICKEIIFTYDLSGDAHEKVKQWLITHRGYRASFVRNGKNWKMPHTTLWKPNTSAFSAKLDLMFAAILFKITVENVLVVPVDLMSSMDSFIYGYPTDVAESARA